MAGLDVPGNLDQAFGEFGAAARRHHPSDDAAAEDIEDRREVEVDPLDGPKQFGDAPTPELVERGGRQCGLPVGRMSESIRAYAREVAEIVRESAPRSEAGRGKAEGGHFPAVADEEEARSEDGVVPGFAFESGDFGEFGEPRR